MKLQKQSIRKIDISLINETENIRKEYRNIEQLANSIERDGQLEPIGVIENENGTFDMLYGFRRLKAFQFLVAEKKDFNQIEAKITNGNPVIIQMIENESRENLTPEEFESGIRAMLETGMTQTDIANRLCISLQRVSDTLAAEKTRSKLKHEGYQTDEISTSAMSQLRNIPEEKKEEVITEVKKKGGTVKAAKEAKKKIKQKPEEQMSGIIDCVDKPITFMTLSEFFDDPKIKNRITELIIDNVKIDFKCIHCGEKII